ncbi:MexE family multidrug efflux RND transporter periplasmic adaptor subunit [Luteitalea sp. TBR-22]|uniref:efflux RND transporter periplasmic adaptor subunit n=1 Tax=Luteitalea sp. TBR-22 TaxID=2802971 RepID=UPI001AFBE64F|nr:efflux RND transporter periplasmic adaptor subunit [Luteitalea sp. TBR-22]BCS35692.1 MexE family multidrug efflux RND transporter periplasmic adaptor subunit [Luteitalea sp. TBR-22]
MHMPNTTRALIRIVGAGVLALISVACTTQARSGDAPAPPPTVRTVAATRQDVPLETTFTGRVEPIQRVELRARVGGALDAVLFKEGARVAAGAPLFRIDPRPYAIALTRAQAEQAGIEAQLARARQELARAERLVLQDAVAAEEVDRRRGEVAHLTARLEAARAAVADAALQLDFTTVRAPVAGTIGKLDVTRGNLVTGGPGNGTRLALLQSLDPIYVYFELDPTTAARARLAGQRAWLATVTPFEGGAPASGPIDFIDHSVGAQTGTLRVRARLPNPDGRLLPSSVVRVAFRYGTATRATVIPEVAIGTDQGERYVLVANASGIVEYRGIELGARVRDLRVVANDAVRPGEQVVLPGLPIRPGTKVVPQPEAVR